MNKLNVCRKWDFITKLQGGKSIMWKVDEWQADKRLIMKPYTGCCSLHKRGWQSSSRGGKWKYKRWKLKSCILKLLLQHFSTIDLFSEVKCYASNKDCAFLYFCGKTLKIWRGKIQMVLNSKWVSLNILYLQTYYVLISNIPHYVPINIITKHIYKNIEGQQFSSPSGN